MYPGFNVQSSPPFAVGRKLDNQHIIPNPSLGVDGFNIWWQKIFAQHTAIAAEASALMRAHSRVCPASQARDGHTH